MVGVEFFSGRHRQAPNGRPSKRREHSGEFQLAEITQALAAWSSHKQESDTANERYSSENWEY
jgi:hypothetical protein